MVRYCAGVADPTRDPIELGYADETHALVGVRLVQDIGLPSDRIDFAYDAVGRAWRFVLPPVAVRRLEYRFELRHPDGRTDIVCDPSNPTIVHSAYGDKSVLEFPGYRPPEWLDMPAAPGTWRDLPVASRALGATFAIRVWSPTALSAAGILLAHDGGEYDRLARLGHYSAAMIAAGRVPPHHLVLLSPVERNEWYSANPAYARALRDDVLPRLRADIGREPIVALGASLGALALLHAHGHTPFAGLFLQSGSFFQHRFDSQESGFARYRRVVRFVGAVRRQASVGPAVPTVLTCGAAEENLANNRAMAAALAGSGYPVGFVEVPDAHNFTAWRDAWHPHLADLAGQCWDEAAVRGSAWTVAASVGSSTDGASDKRG